MLAARSLNLRVSVAHTSVSREGTVTMTCALPVPPPTLTSPRSAATRLSSGALSPSLSSLPERLTLTPCNLVCCMIFLCFEIFKTGAL